MPPDAAPDWFENESFWEELYPFMFPQTRFDAAAEQASQAVGLAEPNGFAVLDLCCGPGRHSVALAQQGFQVTGVDRTPLLLNKARELAASSHASVEWVQDDMRAFRRPGSYHLVLSMFTSFGYFADPQEDLLVLRNCWDNLQPGGALVIDVLGKERLAKVFQPTVSATLPDGALVIQRHEIRADWTRIWNEWLIIRDESVRRFTFEHAVYSGQELRGRAEIAGFTDVRLYGSLTGSEYGPHAERLIVVARKPGS
ncbi:MAG: class I SAM-dependent methyltransferase [Actinomycetota bacterium]